MHKLLNNELTDAQYSTVIIAEGIIKQRVRTDSRIQDTMEVTPSIRGSTSVRH
jgi:hypothetical protein